VEAALIVLEGKYRDREIPLPETIFLIGRDPQCHLRPHCPLVSKLHCAIAAWAGKVRVRDLKSRNGTFLNGQPVDGEVAVADGDRLQVGTLVFGFRIKVEKGAPLPAPVREEDVRWLLNLPADAPVLSPTRRTVIKGAEADEADEAESGIAVSAGQYLRDYFGQRREAGPDPPAGLN
jgi:pSer/pThr/pTyr-binding forkhead associated (FHA) protein